MSKITAKWNDREVLIKVSTLVADNLDKAGEWVAERARQLAPVRSGRLKKGIDYLVVAKGEEISAIIGVKKESKAFYARFVEKGTKKTKAQPFLRPAVFDNQKIIERIVKEGK